MGNYNKFGVMLDCSRNAVLNVNSVKKYIDILKKIGYNCLLLYTEDTYEIKEEPYFGYLRGRYSHEEIKEIDKYARENGIELIPCIQTLAHLNAIFRWRCYDEIRDCNDILLLKDQRTYDLIDKMFKNLSECFTSRLVNVGMDEAAMIGLGKFLYEHGVMDRHEIMLEHINKVNEIAKKYGFKPMMWSDMFYSMASNGQYYATDVVISDKVKNLVPKEMGLIYWDYCHTDIKVYDEMIKGHQQFNNEIWFASGIWTWDGFVPHIKFANKTAKIGFTSCKKNGIKNMFITCWKDNGGECSFFAALPSLFYSYEIANGITKISEIKKNFYDIFNVKYDYFANFEILNKVEGKKEGDSHFVNPSKYMLYNDPFLGVADGSVEEHDGECYKKYSRKIKSMKSKMGEYGYLCDYYGSLADVLVYKFALGYKTRKYYKENNKEALKEVIKEYDLTISKLKKFIKAFQNAWFIENKPHGFDIQDIRLGGLMQRLISCKERLNLYVNNKIDKIDELEEEILNMDGKSGKNLSKDTQCINNYQFSATVNIL